LIVCGYPSTGAEKKSEYIYSRSREVRKENPPPIIDILTLKSSVQYNWCGKFLHFREHGFSNSVKKLVFRTFFSNANNSQIVNMLFYHATLCACLMSLFFNVGVLGSTVVQATIFLLYFAISWRCSL